MCIKNRLWEWKKRDQREGYCSNPGETWWLRLDSSSESTKMWSELSHILNVYGQGCQIAFQSGCTNLSSYQQRKLPVSPACGQVSTLSNSWSFTTLCKQAAVCFFNWIYVFPFVSEDKYFWHVYKRFVLLFTCLRPSPIFLMHWWSYKSICQKSLHIKEISCLFYLLSFLNLTFCLDFFYNSPIGTFLIWTYLQLLIFSFKVTSLVDRFLCANNPFPKVSSEYSDPSSFQKEQSLWSQVQKWLWLYSLPRDSTCAYRAKSFCKGICLLC